MSPRDTAERQLDRLLYILPAAARPGGASLEELARALDVTRDRVVGDVQELTTRTFYHPAGSGSQLQVNLTDERVSIWSGGRFERPVRLSPLEALSVALGCRVLARDRGAQTVGSSPSGDESGPEGRPEPPAKHAALARLLTRLETALATGPFPVELEDHLDAADGPPDPEGIRATVLEAARDRRVCRIHYLKAHAPAPEPRRIHPYAVVHGGTDWYAVGWAENRDAVRIFRLDRVVGAEILDERFTVREGFRVDDYVTGPRVFHGEDTLEVVVRYSPKIAPWIRERGMGEEREDGSVVVRHEVTDPVWIVRRVLQYGGEAVVEEPEEIRRLVVEVAEGAIAPES